MEKVSVVGCGLMGSALSMAFLKGGNRVLVYDIIKEKCSSGHSALFDNDFPNFIQ